MSDHVEQGKERLQPSRSLSPEDATEKVDALWRQMMVYKAFAESSLSEAKARRAQAEEAREKAEQEAAEATRSLYETMKSEADKKHSEAEALKSEAVKVLEQAETERSRAEVIAKEAEEARQRIIAAAKQKAQDIQDQARIAAQQEYTELRRQALKEIQAIMGRVETIRAATDEEHETQRIFSNIAKLKATSPSLLELSGYQEDGAAADHHGLPPGDAPSQETEAAEQASPAQDDPSSQPAEPMMKEAPAEEQGNAKGPAQSKAGPKGKEKKANKA